MIPIYTDDITNSTVAKTRGTVFRCIGGRAWRPVTDPTTTWEDWYEAGRAERYSYDTYSRAERRDIHTYSHHRGVYWASWQLSWSRSAPSACLVLVPVYETDP